AEATEGESEHSLPQDLVWRCGRKEPGRKVLVHDGCFGYRRDTVWGRSDAEAGAHKLEADRRVESLLPGDVVEKLGELQRHTLLHRFLENRAPPAIQSFDGDSVLDRGPEQSGTAEVGV